MTPYIKTKSRWSTEEELLLLTMLGDNANYSEVANVLNKSVEAVRKKARNLGVKPRYRLVQTPTTKMGNAISYQSKPSFNFAANCVVQISKKATEGVPISEFTFKETYSNKRGKRFHTFVSCDGNYRETFTDEQLFDSLTNHEMRRLEENEVLTWINIEYPVVDVRKTQRKLTQQEKDIQSVYNKDTRRR